MSEREDNHYKTDCRADDCVTIRVAIAANTSVFNMGSSILLSILFYLVKEQSQPSQIARTSNCQGVYGYVRAICIILVGQLANCTSGGTVTKIG